MLLVFQCLTYLEKWKVSLTHKPETLVILSLSQSVVYKAWVFDCYSVAFKHPEHQHLDPERQTSRPEYENKRVQNKSPFFWVIQLRVQGTGSTGAKVGHLKILQQSRSLTYKEACLLRRRRPSPSLRHQALEAAARQGKWPDSAVSWVSTSWGGCLDADQPWITDETPDTGNGGGSLHHDQHHGGGDELFSSEVNSSFQGGWVEKMFKSWEDTNPVWSCQGQSAAEPNSCDQAPKVGICLARSDHETTRVYSMWTTIWPWDPRWSWTSPTSCSPCEADLRAVLQLNCSSSGGATPAAVIVLYLFSTLSVTTLTAQSLVPVECCLFLQCSTMF